MEGKEMEDLDVNRKLNIIKHRKKQAANDAQLLMLVCKMVFFQVDDLPL